MNQQRNNADFVSVAPIKRQREIRPINKTKKHSGVSSILTICAVMLCCMLVLSVAFIEEPYMQTSAGGYSAQPRTLGEEILGRLVYLCEEFVDVFTPHNSLTMPVNGKVLQTVTDTGGYTEFAADAGAEIYAAADGRVKNVYSDETGVIVEVSHDDGTLSRYSALSEAVVEVHQPVRCGDVLGISLSGRLRFFYEAKGSYCDPLPLFGVSRR